MFFQRIRCDILCITFNRFLCIDLTVEHCMRYLFCLGSTPNKQTRIIPFVTHDISWYFCWCRYHLIIRDALWHAFTLEKRFFFLCSAETWSVWLVNIYFSWGDLLLRHSYGAIQCDKLFIMCIMNMKLDTNSTHSKNRKSILINMLVFSSFFRLTKTSSPFKKFRLWRTYIRKKYQVTMCFCIHCVFLNESSTDLVTERIISECVGVIKLKNDMEDRVSLILWYDEVQRWGLYKWWSKSYRMRCQWK